MWKHHWNNLWNLPLDHQCADLSQLDNIDHHWRHPSKPSVDASSSALGGSHDRKCTGTQAKQISQHSQTSAQSENQKTLSDGDVETKEEVFQRKKDQGHQRKHLECHELQKVASEPGSRSLPLIRTCQGTKDSSRMQHSKACERTNQSEKQRIQTLLQALQLVRNSQKI